MSEFQIWLWFVVLPGLRDALLGTAWVVSTIAAIVSCGVGIQYVDSSKEERKIIPIKKVIALLLIAMTIPIIRAVIPTEKQAAAIILIPAITQSDRVRNIGDKTLDMLNGKLDQWLKDMGSDIPVKSAQKGEKL